MLTYKQFLILQSIEKNGKQTQRFYAKDTNISLGAVNSVLVDLKNSGYISNGVITSEGYKSLEPYRVKRAVLLAAEFDSRIIPVTLNTPKPLVRIHGKRIIDSLLDAVIAAGIEEIYIVRGYLKEQFDVLLEKYPNIRFIDNPLYNQTNNISSALYAGEKIINAYVMESDLFLKNPKLISKYQYETNYLGIKVKRTDDYCIYEKGHYIDSVSRGGENCYKMVGITYWNETDGTGMAEDIKNVFYNVPAGKEVFWGTVATVHNRGKYRIGIRECNFDDVIEIDTFEELTKIDPAYKTTL